MREKEEKNKAAFLAHINEETGEEQTIKEHSENTANLARVFSVKELKEICYTAGLLHDCGKFSQGFQDRIKGKNIRVEHSTCGAIVAKERYEGAVSLLIQLCIAGHHGGIPDCIGEENASLEERLKREFEDYSAYQNELEIPDVSLMDFLQFIGRDCSGPEKDKEILDKFAFFVRYVFSCLTDADSLDTEKFCTGKTRQTLKTDFEKCLERLNKRLSSFVVETELQRMRACLQQQVYDKVGVDSEIYLMNMPTGSGKTLCSMKFALERAIAKGKKRIIYVIPYNSIIDQTAEEFTNLFQEDAQILRHQSTFSIEDSDEDYVRTVKLATENWDADFIITTAVQFFESIYANKRGKLRKLHNMGDSILVFDEIHMMPLDYLQPCLEAVTYITKYLNSEAVFLTATMPDFASMFRKYALSNTKVLNLITDETGFAAFRRCGFQNLGLQSKEALLSKAMKVSSSLIVVNKRKSAREFYSMLQGFSGQVYHLSTYMTAYDRRNTIVKIRTKLQCLKEMYSNLSEVPEEQRMIVVSTTVIEAGVDLDFETVFREVAGVDNILQAGGRCNREGKRENAVTYIFELEEERYETKNNENEKRAEITRGIMQEYEDLTSPEAVRMYYQRLFKIHEPDAIKNSMYQLCRLVTTIPFRQYSEQFELIDSRTVSIVVVQDETSKNLIDHLRITGAVDTRKLQMYTCSIQFWEFEDLFRQGVIETLGNGAIYCLANQDYYNEKIGVLFEGKDYFINN